MAEHEFIQTHLRRFHVDADSCLALNDEASNSRGTASITVLLPDNTVARIRQVCIHTINTKCALLGYTFEDGIDGSQACLEASSENAVVCLLRYLYTDNYLTRGEEHATIPTLLIHVEVYKLARDFDIPELQVAAYCNFSRETELSCSMPNPLVDLCDTISFVYKHLPNEQSIVDTLLHYCVSVFGYHRLGSNQTFRQAAFDNPEFHRALCETNYKRDFQDEGASEIVCMSACRSFDRPIALFEMDNRTQSEFQFEEWYDPDAVKNPLEHKDEVPTTKRRKTITGHAIPLVHRLREPEPDLSVGDEFSNREDFVLVHCTKPKKPTMDGTYTVVITPSSSEMVASPSLESDKDSTFGSSDDEEWSPVDTPGDGTASDDGWALL